MWGKKRPDGRVGAAAQQQEPAAAAPREPDSEPGSEQRRGGASRTGLTVAAAAGIAVIAGVAGLAVLANSKAGAPGHPKAVGYGMGHAAAGGHKQLGGGASIGMLRVMSVSPTAGSADASGIAPVQVAFSAPLAANSAMPVLSPSVPGQWQVSGSVLTFTPDAPISPSTRFTLRIPAGQAGVRSAAGGLLAKPGAIRFSTTAYSRQRLAELLGQLGYLPMSWQPAAAGRLVGGTPGSGMAAQQAMAYSPPAGSFTWHRGYPSALRAQWLAGPNLLVRGALMAFQAQHGLAIDGVATRKVWHALFVAADRGRRNLAGYTYAIASKGSPETLSIWHDGKMVLRTLANTGIPVAPTAAGTYPVYLRYRFQIMQGTNPDGSHYADPVSFVSYFDAGEAVHYFPRGSYGFPQSLGCVELPYDSAERAWPYLTYGSLVTVAG